MDGLEPLSLRFCLPDYTGAFSACTQEQKKKQINTQDYYIGRQNQEKFGVSPRLSQSTLNSRIVVMKSLYRLNHKRKR